MKGRNSVELGPDNRIHITFYDDLDVVSLSQYWLEANLLMAGLRQDKKLCLILVDARYLNSVKLDFRKYGVKWLKKADYDKISIYGNTLFMKYFVS